MLRHERVYEGKVVSLDVDEVEEPGEVQGKREVVRQSGSVAALPVLSDGRIVLVRQYRYAVDAFVWELPAGNLSGGQKQMLSISRAIVEPRKLILIDEPTKGLAPAIINNLIEAFAELKKTDTTILMVEQNFHAARALGDTVAVMDSGRIVHAGRMAELAADQALQTRLLGLSLEAHQ